jgi:hypothetical protein
MLSKVIPGGGDAIKKYALLPNDAVLREDSHGEEKCKELLLRSKAQSWKCASARAARDAKRCMRIIAWRRKMRCCEQRMAHCAVRYQNDNAGYCTPSNSENTV